MGEMWGGGGCMVGGSSPWHIWSPCKLSNKTNMSNFHRLEVVGRASETQLQVGENLTYLI